MNIDEAAMVVVNALNSERVPYMLAGSFCVIAVQGNCLDWTYISKWCTNHGTLEKLNEIRRSIPPLSEDAS